MQLFNAGHLRDVLPIWRAKESSWDAHFAIDVQFLAGPGLDATIEFLRSDVSPDAPKALQYLLECIEARDFENFSPEKWTQNYAQYFDITE